MQFLTTAHAPKSENFLDVRFSPFLRSSFDFKFRKPFCLSRVESIYNKVVKMRVSLVD